MAKRKNSTKKERTELLKRMGYSEDDMQKFWDECKEVNTKIKLLSKAGLNRTDLCIWQIEQLPTLKETTLKQIAELEENKKKEEDEAKKYSFEHFDKLMVQKIDNNEELTESELRKLVFECEEVDKSYGENKRWSRTVTSIIKLGNRYFAVVWEEGLTESQENEFYNQPYEVELDSYKKIIEVKNWYKKGDKKPDKINELKLDLVIDKITEFMYCNYKDCCMNEDMSWEDLQAVREYIKENMGY